MKPTNRERGQSLIEAIVAVAAVVLIVTGLIVGTTQALRASQLARARSLANKYSQEAIELTRNLRDSGWTLFQTRSGRYCLAKDNSWPAGPSANCTPNIDNTYTREAIFSWDGVAERMIVTVRTSWSEGAVTRQSELTTYFTRWR